MLVVICLALFASFVWVGVMISTLFGRKTEGIGKLYFADLVGAGLACAVVVSLISTIGPPRTIALAGAILAAVGVRGGGRALRSRLAPVGGVLVAGLAVCVRVLGRAARRAHRRGQGRRRRGPTSRSGAPSSGSTPPTSPNGLLLNHDGMLGSVIKPWDGDVASLGDDLYNFDGDPRAYPFDRARRRRPSG